MKVFNVILNFIEFYFRNKFWKWVSTSDCDNWNSYIKKSIGKYLKTKDQKNKDLNHLKYLFHVTELNDLEKLLYWRGFRTNKFYFLFDSPFF